MKTHVIYLILAIGILLVYYFTTVRKLGFTNSNSNKTIILLGDSILNNSNYVESDETVSALIKKTCLSDSKSVILKAQDNTKIYDVYSQVDSLIDSYNIETTYVFLSVGGNNMLDSKFVSLDNLKEQYIKLVSYIHSKLPKSEIYLLGLYYPFDTRFHRYNSNIESWNNFIKGTGYKNIMLDGLLTNKSDIIFSIEPSATGSKKIANEICKVI
jgi:hypothetical protein